MIIGGDLGVAISTVIMLLQPGAPPSYVLPYLLCLWVLTPIGSITITAIVDFVLRGKYNSKFFWRHWWHVIPLVAITFTVTSLLNPGYPMEFAYINPFLALFVVFTATHFLWIVLIYFTHGMRNSRSYPISRTKFEIDTRG